MMQPLKPEEKERILANRPELAPGDLDALVEEYEQLLASRYHRDPDQTPSPARTEILDSRQQRLTELHRLLFVASDEEEGQERAGASDSAGT